MSNEVIVKEQNTLQAKEIQIAMAFVTAIQGICWMFSGKIPILNKIIEALDEIKKCARGEITEAEARTNVDKMLEEAHTQNHKELA